MDRTPLACLIGTVVAICLLVALLVDAARAQDALPLVRSAAETSVFDQLRPVLGEITALLITAILGLAFQRFRIWTGMEIEARHRDALQSALANAARIAVAGGGKVELGRAVGYVARSVPDALAHFDAEDELRIKELLGPHIERLKSAAP
jgi:hypothetical protein